VWVPGAGTHIPTPGVGIPPGRRQTPLNVRGDFQLLPAQTGGLGVDRVDLPYRRRRPRMRAIVTQTSETPSTSTVYGVRPDQGGGIRTHDLFVPK
jgi:hypothetical protein